MVQLTSVQESWAWMRSDIVARLGPFALAVLATWLIWRPRWLGLAPGELPAQLLFGIAGAAVLFGAAVLVQLPLTRRRGGLRVPADGADLALQGAYYVVNGPLEEAFFRGLAQGGISIALGAPPGFVIATAVYVLYHRLGRWTWPDTLATALVGVPLGLAFWLLPGPPSLLGVSLAHIAATFTATFIIGFAFGAIMVPAQTLIQRETPHDMLGRVGSTNASVIFLGQILGLVISGTLAELVGVRMVFFLCAGLSVALAVGGRIFLGSRGRL